MREQTLVWLALLLASAAAYCPSYPYNDLHSRPLRCVAFGDPHYLSNFNKSFEPNLSKADFWRFNLSNDDWQKSHWYGECATLGRVAAFVDQRSGFYVELNNTRVAYSNYTFSDAVWIGFRYGVGTQNPPSNYYSSSSTADYSSSSTASYSSSTGATYASSSTARASSSSSSTAPYSSSTASYSSTALPQQVQESSTGGAYQLPPCKHGDYACIGDDSAQCVWGKWYLHKCGDGYRCLPCDYECIPNGQWDWWHAQIPCNETVIPPVYTSTGPEQQQESTGVYQPGYYDVCVGPPIHIKGWGRDALVIFNYTDVYSFANLSRYAYEKHLEAYNESYSSGNAYNFTGWQLYDGLAIYCGINYDELIFSYLALNINVTVRNTYWAQLYPAANVFEVVISAPEKVVNVWNQTSGFCVDKYYCPANQSYVAPYSPPSYSGRSSEYPFYERTDWGVRTVYLNDTDIVCGIFNKSRALYDWCVADVYKTGSVAGSLLTLEALAAVHLVDYYDNATCSDYFHTESLIYNAQAACYQCYYDTYNSTNYDAYYQFDWNYCRANISILVEYLKTDYSCLFVRSPDYTYQSNYTISNILDEYELYQQYFWLLEGFWDCEYPYELECPVYPAPCICPYEYDEPCYCEEYLTCATFGDPHVRNFKGEFYDCQAEGRQLVYHENFTGLMVEADHVAYADGNIYKNDRIWVYSSEYSCGSAVIIAYDGYLNVYDEWYRVNDTFYIEELHRDLCFDEPDSVYLSTATSDIPGTYAGQYGASSSSNYSGGDTYECKSPQYGWKSYRGFTIYAGLNEYQAIIRHSSGVIITLVWWDDWESWDVYIDAPVSVIGEHAEYVYGYCYDNSQCPSSYPSYDDYQSSSSVSVYYASSACKPLCPNQDLFCMSLYDDCLLDVLSKSNIGAAQSAFSAYVHFKYGKYFLQIAEQLQTQQSPYETVSYLCPIYIYLSVNESLTAAYDSCAACRDDCEYLWTNHLSLYEDVHLACGAVYADIWESVAYLLQQADYCLVDECNSNPCQNEATCVDGRGSYSCLCPDGYSGQYCQSPVEELSSSTAYYSSSSAPYSSSSTAAYSSSSSSAVYSSSTGATYASSSSAVYSSSTGATYASSSSAVYSSSTGATYASSSSAVYSSTQGATYASSSTSNGGY